MSSAQSLREFIRERLTAAAAEIFSEFEQTIVRYEEEIDRQRRLLEISWKPQINLHRIASPELQQHCLWDKEVLTDLQISNQETTSTFDQKEPEYPQIKEEQQELCIRQHEGPFIPKQKNVTFMVTSPFEETDFCEPEPNRIQPSCQSSTEAENHVQDRCMSESSEQNSNEELTRNYVHQQTKYFIHGVDLGNIRLIKRVRGGRPHACGTCGKNFSHKADLTKHIRVHTGEKPYSCQICGRRCATSGNMTAHMRIHTGEKPHACETCGRCFSRRHNLSKHMTNVHRCTMLDQ